MIKIALVGLGQLGAHHARILATSRLIASEKALLSAVVDSNRARALEIGGKYNIPYFTEIPPEILSDITAAVIVTPTPSHYALAKKFLESGIHCFVEKPFTSTLEEADELIKIARDGNLILQVGHIERFNPAVRAAMPYVKKPLFIEACRIGNFSPRVAHIGVVMDLMIHDIDIVLMYLARYGKVESVEAYGAKVLTEHEDMAKVRLKFSNGCVCDLSASRLSPQSVERRLRIFQKDSYISVDYAKRDVKIYMKPVGPTGNFMDIKMIKPDVEQRDQLESELLHFIECVSKKKEPEVSGEHGRNALELASEICRNMIFLSDINR